jgi:hypothetical protein
MASGALRQRMYLIQELDVAMVTIEAGLTAIQASRPYRPRHSVFLLLLATGIERLMKIVLHVHALETTGAFLTESYMKKHYGHDLVKLCEGVIANCFTQAHLARPVARDDLDFIRHDAIFQPMLTLLADFAKTDRYVYLSGISDPEVTTDWPGRRWEQLERATMPPGEYMRLVIAGQEHAAKQHANRALVACLERFVRAVARLFVTGVLGDQARQVSPAVSHYVMLNDEDLGTKMYSL